MLPFCEISEQILKVISDKVANGELEDTSTTIGQMSSGSKGTSTSKLRLAIEGEQAKQEEERHDGKTTLSITVDQGEWSVILLGNLRWPNTVFQYTGVSKHYLKTMYF